MTRLLVAGVGNVFHGDDGFGVAVAQRLLAGPGIPGARIVELGIRSFDLAMALSDCDAAIIVDALQRGAPPGTLTVLDAATSGHPEEASSAHGLHPAAALELAAALGGTPRVCRVVGCEPASLEPRPDLELSPSVRAAVQPAIDLVVELAAELQVPDRA